MDHRCGSAAGQQPDRSRVHRALDKATIALSAGALLARSRHHAADRQTVSRFPAPPNRLLRRRGCSDISVDTYANQPFGTGSRIRRGLSSMEMPRSTPPIGSTQSIIHCRPAVCPPWPHPRTRGFSSQLVRHRHGPALRPIRSTSPRMVALIPSGFLTRPTPLLSTMGEESDLVPSIASLKMAPGTQETLPATADAPTTTPSSAPVQLTGVVSTKQHGAAGSFNMDLPLTGHPGIECRSGGASGNYTLIFTFANALTRVDGVSISTGPDTLNGGAIAADAHQYFPTSPASPAANISR